MHIGGTGRGWGPWGSGGQGLPPCHSKIKKYLSQEYFFKTLFKRFQATEVEKNSNMSVAMP